MDKFANGDERHPDAEEYVTVQSCIDEAKEKEVFVLATVNNLRCLPRSLRRAGRFDRVIEIDTPHGKDAVNIISHYLSNKKVSKDIDAKTIARIMDGRSCAELETVINEAGLYAGYERAESITMDHFMEACLRTVFDVPASLDDDDDDYYTLLSDSNNVISQIVYHEAGHAVISEILCPESVNLVSAYNRGGAKGGFTDYYNDRTCTPLHWAKSRIIGSLGGIAAIEQKYGIFDFGGERDLDQAFDRTRDLIVNNCFSGFNLHCNGYNDSERLKSEQEQAVSAEVEKFYRKAKEIISLNQDFFEKIAKTLAEKKLLSAVDIKQIKSECKVVPVTL
jgi:cell division protease FtsH